MNLIFRLFFTGRDYFEAIFFFGVGWKDVRDCKKIIHVYAITVINMRSCAFESCMSEKSNLFGLGHCLTFIGSCNNHLVVKFLKFIWLITTEIDEKQLCVTGYAGRFNYFN